MKETTTYLSYLLTLFFLFTSFSNTAQSIFTKRESTLISGEGAIYGDDTVFGAGISFYDFDNDGWDDITLPASTNKDFQFFRNINGVFTAIDLPISSNDVPAKQVIWVDFDNDSDVDFFGVSDEGMIWLYRNDGNSNYTNITDSAGFTGVAQEDLWSSSWGDYDNDGFLDVFLSVWSSASPSLLFHNNGDGTFTDVSVEAGIEVEGINTFCSSFFDYDNDGDVDIYSANDFCPWENVLYKNNGDGTFTNASSEAGVNLAILAMSTTIDDYDDDGDLDIYVTNISDTCTEETSTIGNAFLSNNGDTTYTEIASDNGTSFSGIAWGASFLDADNDGDKDLLVCSSNNNTSNTQLTTYYEQEQNGQFIIPTNTGLEEDTAFSFGSAIGDINNDGFPDIIVLNIVNDPIYLLENTVSNENSWLKVRLTGVQSNRMGIGALIKVYEGEQVYHNYTLCGEGYISQNSGTEFFGLGSAANIDAVEVHWPSGLIDRIENVTINQTISIQEGQSPLSIVNQNIDQIKIYPNPTVSKIHAFNIQEFNDGVYSLFDSLGRVSQTGRIDSHTLEIDLSTFKKGIYFLRMTHARKSKIYKIIKN